MILCTASEDHVQFTPLLVPLSQIYKTLLEKGRLSLSLEDQTISI